MTENERLRAIDQELRSPTILDQKAEIERLQRRVDDLRELCSYAAPNFPFVRVEEVLTILEDE